MKPKHWLLNEGIYETGVLLVLGGDKYAAICKFAALNKDTPPRIEEIRNPHNSEGAVIECLGRKRFLIWFPDKVVHIATFVHEVNHATLLMLHNSGVSMPSWEGGDEHFTYLSGWLAKKLAEKITITTKRVENKTWKDGEWSK